MAVNQSGYSSQQIMTMQQDAIRRVNEMQRLARERVANSDNRSNQNNQMHPEHHTPQQQNNAVKVEHHNSNTQNNQHHEEKQFNNNAEKNESIKVEHCPTEIVSQGLTGFLDRMNLDTETLLLLGLILLLVNEGADVMLLLALGYILL
ncbi:hypothetical protein RBG61_06965 [Paludicola sp. MB14-C6]|uniref:hypothetical protein n=1 Tax=Paludihabitans sp. MB14-C6 TaxID=3070656 RepID=UPI0027DB99C2|nr:hypothetical protein [Paludicola sp. MB14-C6]WMJ24402.1 hypothetical protein RBG61_06965 [Paludicola sp. MB14-C6]